MQVEIRGFCSLKEHIFSAFHYISNNSGSQNALFLGTVGDYFHRKVLRRGLA
jgi:hypothetical protein